jgi:hypothetical protein
MRGNTIATNVTAVKTRTHSTLKLNKTKRNPTISTQPMFLSEGVTLMAALLIVT